MPAYESRPITLEPFEQSEQELMHLSEAVCELASQIDVQLSADQACLCVEHLLYVMQINEYINLTRITALDEALVLHVADSLSLVPYINSGTSRFLDMGTGAGFPGVPLHIATGIPGVLLDSVDKKVRSVATIANHLGLSNIECVHDRLEDYARKEFESFDLVVARALAPLPVLTEYAAPFLTQGGQFLISKGNPTESELESGLKAASLCGFELRDEMQFELPNQLGHRCIYSFVKSGKAQISLPRPAGAAKRKPLA